MIPTVPLLPLEETIKGTFSQNDGKCKEDSQRADLETPSEQQHSTQRGGEKPEVKKIARKGFMGPERNTRRLRTLPLGTPSCSVQPLYRGLTVAIPPKIKGRKNGQAGPQRQQRLTLQDVPRRQRLSGNNQAKRIHDRGVHKALPKATPADKSQPKQGEKTSKGS